MRLVVKSLIAAAGVIGLSGVALAADPVKPIVVPKPVVVVKQNAFDGFYLGGSVGWGNGNRYGCSDGGTFPAECDVDEDENFNYNQSGWLVGAQAGWNYAFGGLNHSLLIGGEVSAYLSGITGNLTDSFSNNYQGPGDYHWLGLGLAKLGWQIHESLLLYVDGGVAVGGFTYTSNDCTFTSNHQGTAWGGGAAWAVSSANSLFVDYQRIDFQDKDAACTGGPTIGVITKPTIDVVRFGFNHSFGK